MNKIKQLQKWLPELYLVASVVFYWVSTSNLLNLVAVFLLLVLGSLFIWKNKVLGVAISITCICLSLFITLALLSELKEFPTFDREAKTMLLVGGLWLSLNILLSIMMMIKWIKQPSHLPLTMLEATT